MIRLPLPIRVKVWPLEMLRPTPLLVPRDFSADRSRGVASQAVGDQPFLVKVRVGLGIEEGALGHPNQIRHVSLSGAGRKTTAA